jgi:peptidyl-prolyl cis-trans isomerase A (cyclophilin A)
MRWLHPLHRLHRLHRLRFLRWRRCVAPALLFAVFSQPAVGAEIPPAKGEPVRVRFSTSLGAIDVEVDVTRAPVSAGNFLRYVDAGRYTAGRFHRTVTVDPDNQPHNTVKIEVIQGGVAPENQNLDFDPIPLERTRDTGLSHVDGCLSMARDGPDTATSDFFICIGDQPELDFGGRRNPDGQGFAAFGRVVAGMDVVRRIQRSASHDQTLTPPIRIESAVRVAPPSSPASE